MSGGRSFSLLSLFLVLSLAASIAGNFAFRSEAVRARHERDLALQELEEVRRKFGEIRIDEPDKTYFVKIEGEEGETTYRAVFPAGSRYLLHLTDTPMKNSEIPEDLPTTKTMSMNSWRDGTDVILKWSMFGGDEMRFVVETHAEQLFNYEVQGWNNGNHPNEGFDLEAEPIASFGTNQKVILTYFGNDKLERGIVLWLEPHAQWEKRRAEKD